MKVTTVRYILGGDDGVLRRVKRELDYQRPRQGTVAGVGAT